MYNVDELFNESVGEGDRKMVKRRNSRVKKPFKIRLI